MGVFPRLTLFGISFFVGFRAILRRQPTIPHRYQFHECQGHRIRKHDFHSREREGKRVQLATNRFEILAAVNSSLTE